MWCKRSFSHSFFFVLREKTKLAGEEGHNNNKKQVLNKEKYLSVTNETCSSEPEGNRNTRQETPSRE
jgi:hypothetical protein